MVAFVFAIGFSLVLFKASPALLTDLLGLNGVVFALVEGAIRVGILVGYLALLSLIPDLKRVFQYHAAEHMAINALEAGDELTPDRRRGPLPHPRPLRHRVPALGDDRLDRRLRRDRQAGPLVPARALAASRCCCRSPASRTR